MTSPWWQQHTDLDDLVRALEETLPRGGETARAAWTAFAQAIDAHFAVEEDVYFGLVHRLCPDLETRVARAREAHDAIRAEIRRVGEELGASESAHVQRLLGGLLAAFGEHERLESLLVRALAERGEEE